MASFKEIKQLRRMVDSSILRMPGIMGVATGFKKKGGKRTKELSLIIYVAKKLSLDRIPYFHAIPSMLEIRGAKVSTDIVEVGYYIPYSYTARERPAKGGVSIGHHSITAGTLGTLVCGPAEDSKSNSVLILSNNHVLAASNNGVHGDEILQPGPHDGGTSPADTIATLERFVPIDFTSGAVNYVDCAVALPQDSSDVSFEIHDIGYPKLSEFYTLTENDVVNQTQVQKTGRTTEHTVGVVTAVDWKGSVLYDWTPAYFEKQIVVEPVGAGPVAQGGDSGSAVLTMDNKLCGLLFAGPTSGDHFIANHIGEVITRLDVKLCCATSESSSSAKSMEALPTLRKFRDKMKTAKGMKKYLDIYGKHASKVLEMVLQDPSMAKTADKLIAAAGAAVEAPNNKIDDELIRTGLELINLTVKKRKNDRAFTADMTKLKTLLPKLRGKTVSSALRTLRQ